MDSNNIKYSTDSQETIKKILDEMKKANSPNKKEDNRSVDNKKLSKNNTSNSKLDDAFHRLYNNSNRRINRKLRTLKISKNIIGNKSQGNSFKSSNDIDTSKILGKKNKK